MKKIEGVYNEDKNFITVYVDEEKRVYTIPKNSPRNWGSVELTEENFTRLSSGAEKFGCFELSE